MASMHFSGVRDAAPSDEHFPNGHPRNGHQIAHTSDAAASWLTTADAARVLGVSPSTVRRRIADGQLTARREPYHQSFRWLVLLPDSPAPSPVAGAPVVEARDPSDTKVDRVTLALVREADDELRSIASRVDLTRHAVVSILERERNVALRQAALLEELADNPPGAVAATTAGAASATRSAEGSRRALLIGLFVCIAAAVGSTLLALPAWTGGIVGALAVVAGLVATVEAYLVATDWLARLGRRDRESA